MRIFAIIVTFGALVSASSLTCAGDENSAAALPTRKAGLWELKTSMDEGSGSRDQTMKMCVDEKMEANTVLASAAEHKSNCEGYKVKADGVATVVEADCVFNKRKVVSTTTMTGDFKTAFEVKINSTTSNPEAKDQSVVIKRTISQVGKYLAESCGDLKPGEAEGTDGTR
ncbi:MAG: DUF3617 family protein, partial [Hyphomicrobium sp.]